MEDRIAGIKIAVYNPQRDLKIASSSAVQTLASLLDFCEVSCDEIALHFVSKKKIASLHAKFFDDPTPTDCITFPYDNEEGEPYVFLGELFVCPQAAKEYVAKRGGDIYREVTLYIVHGILHLLGFDDMNELDRKQMRREETKMMKYLAKSSLYIHS